MARAAACLWNNKITSYDVFVRQSGSRVSVCASPRKGRTQLKVTEDKQGYPSAMGWAFSVLQR